MHITWTKPVTNNLVWPDVPNELPRPRLEIMLPEFLRSLNTSEATLEGVHFEQVYLKSCNTASNDLWTVHYYWLPKYGLAVASLYTTYQNWKRKKQQGKGIFTLDDPRLDLRIAKHAFGYAYRFFRLGCTHEKKYEMTSEEASFGYNIHLERMEHAYRCPDCGQQWVNDSSG